MKKDFTSKSKQTQVKGLDEIALYGIQRRQCKCLVQKREKVRVHNVQSAVGFTLFDYAGYVDLAGTCVASVSKCKSDLICIVHAE